MIAPRVSSDPDEARRSFFVAFSRALGDGSQKSGMAPNATTPHGTGRAWQWAAPTHGGSNGCKNVDLERLTGGTGTVGRACEQPRQAVRRQSAWQRGRGVLIDRKEAVGLTLTLWDSGAAALVTDAGAEKSRASTVPATGVELVARGQYEVLAKAVPSAM